MNGIDSGSKSAGLIRKAVTVAVVAPTVLGMTASAANAAPLVAPDSMGPPANSSAPIASSAEHVALARAMDNSKNMAGGCSIEILEPGSTTVTPDAFPKLKECLTKVQAKLDDGQGIGFVPEDQALKSTTDSAPIPTNPAGCLLQANNPHLRKSSNYTMVGAKPLVECKRNVGKIEVATSIIIKEWMGIFNHPVLVGKVAVNHGQRRLLQKNAEWLCQNDHRSEFFAYTTSKIVILGKTYLSAGGVVTETLPLNCGY